MAERKYDLALVDTVTEKPIKHQEWYKERLTTKYIKKLKPGERINSHNTKNWVFMKDGLDDFRDGLPPVVQGSDFVKLDKGPGPAIHYEIGKENQIKQPAARKRLSKYQMYLSRSTPQQQQRRDYINEVEQGLLKHPLALYPHLEDSVVPERRSILKKRLNRLKYKNSHSVTIKLFEDIVDLLDPQFNIQDLHEEMDEQADMYSGEGQRSGYSGSETMFKSHRDADKGMKDLDEIVNNMKRNPYRWLPRKDKDKKEGKKTKEKDKPWPTSPSEEEHIKKVTQEFCDWVADLGGESNNIEESTITSLFASGYETKPALSVPIHVVELTNVPQELRLSAAVPPPPPVASKPAVAEEEPDKPIGGEYQPSWVKFKYGAWYLNPRTWKKMDHDEPLTDPKQLKEHEMSEAKKKSNELNQELSNMHASKAFADFINKKGTRRPEFLVEVAEIQKRQAEEELRKQASEMVMKGKKNGGNETRPESQVATA